MSNSSLQGLSLALPLTSFGNVLMFLFSVSLTSSIIFLNMSVCVSILLNRALRNENRFMYMLSTCFSDMCYGGSYYYAGILDVTDIFGSPTRTYYVVLTFLVLSYMAILASQRPGGEDPDHHRASDQHRAGGEHNVEDEDEEVLLSAEVHRQRDGGVKDHPGAPPEDEHA